MATPLGNAAHVLFQQKGQTRQMGDGGLQVADDPRAHLDPGPDREYSSQEDMLRIPTNKDPPPADDPRVFKEKRKIDEDIQNFQDLKKRLPFNLLGQGIVDQYEKYPHFTEAAGDLMETLPTLNLSPPLPTDYIRLLNEKGRTSLLWQRFRDAIAKGMNTYAGVGLAPDAAKVLTELVVQMGAQMPDHIGKMFGWVAGNWKSVPGQAFQHVAGTLQNVLMGADRSPGEKTVALIILGLCMKVSTDVIKTSMKRIKDVAGGVSWSTIIDIYKQENLLKREEEEKKAADRAKDDIEKVERFAVDNRNPVLHKFEEFRNLWGGAHLLRNVKEQIELIQMINEKGCWAAVDNIYSIVGDFSDKRWQEYAVNSKVGGWALWLAESIESGGPFIEMQIRFGLYDDHPIVQGLEKRPTPDDVMKVMMYKKFVTELNEHLDQKRISNNQCSPGEVLSILMFFIADGWSNGGGEPEKKYLDLVFGGESFEKAALSDIFFQFLKKSTSQNQKDGLLVDAEGYSKAWKVFSNEVVKALKVWNLANAEGIILEWATDWWFEAVEQWWVNMDEGDLKVYCDDLAGHIIDHPGRPPLGRPSPQDAASLPILGGGKRRKKSKRKPRKTIRRKTIRRKTIRRKSTKRKTNKRKSKRNLRKTNVRKKSRKLSRK